MSLQILRLGLSLLQVDPPLNLTDSFPEHHAGVNPVELVHPGMFKVDISRSVANDAVQRNPDGNRPIR